MKIVRRPNSRAYMLLEAIVAVGLISITLACFTYAVAQSAKQQAHRQLRLRAILAAESVLNETRAGVEPSAADFARRFPGLSLCISRQPGTGDWAGLTRVTVRIRSAGAGGDSGAGAVELARLEGHIRETSP